MWYFLVLLVLLWSGRSDFDLLYHFSTLLFKRNLFCLLNFAARGRFHWYFNTLIPKITKTVKVGCPKKLIPLKTPLGLIDHFLAFEHWKIFVRSLTFWPKCQNMKNGHKSAVCWHFFKTSRCKIIYSSRAIFWYLTLFYVGDTISELWAFEFKKFQKFEENGKFVPFGYPLYLGYTWGYRPKNFAKPHHFNSRHQKIMWFWSTPEWGC